MVELVGNKAIEEAALAWVMELERAAGRTPRDTRFAGAPADIESLPRLIEVKAFGKSNRGYDLWLEVRQVEEARSNANFYLYVIENVRQGDPALFTLKVLGGERLRRLLERAKEQRYYTLPWPVADYDACPSSLDS
jgi:Protein NO VEIN, C-terminal